jgi:hypothetical protein
VHPHWYVLCTGWFWYAVRTDRFRYAVRTGRLWYVVCTDRLWYAVRTGWFWYVVHPGRLWFAVRAGGLWLCGTSSRVVLPSWPSGSPRLRPVSVPEPLATWDRRIPTRRVTRDRRTQIRGGGGRLGLGG